ncbi:MAG: Flp pilus assembly complex ATPase component TadA [Verrucomicrobiae bacterium]|nr:Flp pilus assembly complex ATPase component TadA [Verrucomicrobiae bacterium]MCB1085572.1 Flp pilus assembly complex ATPase component TadA [Verrucomicrobiae bacterium]MCB1091841.1 Flp pilus assembly complex ATPase component TadA [Verrucomicrobiae bacterium]
MNEFAYGQQVLNEVFAQAGGNSISDIQVRSNRMVYVHTKQGLQIIYTLGELPNQVVMNVAELLYSRQEADAAQSVEAKLQEQMPLQERLAEFKVVDFSCEGFPMADGTISGRMRVQVHLSASGIGITARILSDDIAELEKLGLSDDTVRAMKGFVKRRQGLAFVTGQTGSGKSTTLAGLIDWLRKSYPKHIVTIEDPIEYRYPHDMADPKDPSRRAPAPGFCTQQEVGKHVKTYRQGLKDALRKAPHLILIGEIRDRDTMDTAIEAAQTGHFVISTLHTNGAVKTMSRILEMFPHEQHKALLGRLAEILCFILSQGLIPTQKGRVLNYEFLQNNDSSVRSAIAAYDGAAKSLEDAIRHSGNVAWDSNLENLMRQGKIDFEAFQMNRMNEDDADSRLFIPQRAAV